MSGRARLGVVVALSGLLVLGGLWVRAQRYSRALRDMKLPAATERWDSYPRLLAIAKQVAKSPEAAGVPLQPGTATLSSCGVRYLKANAHLLAPCLALRGVPCVVPASATKADRDALDDLWYCLGLSALGQQGEGNLDGAADTGLALVEFGLRLTASRDLHAERPALDRAFMALGRACGQMSGPTARRTAHQLEQMVGAMPSPGDRVRHAAPALIMASMEFAARPKPPANERGGQHRQRHVGSVLFWEAVRIAIVGLRPSAETHRAQLAARCEAFAKEVDKPFDQQTPPRGARRFGLSEDAGRVSLVRSAAIGRLLTVQLALRAYQADHGAFPDRLDGLCPTYLRRVPRDPFHDAPLSYRRCATGYLCWSVGPDGRDDMGARSVRTDSRGIDLWPGLTAGSQGDLVVPLP